MRSTLVLLLCAALAACGGDTQVTQAPVSWSDSARLVYAYPYDGQQRVAPAAPVVLQYSQPVATSDGAPLASAFTLQESGGAAVAFTATTTAGGRGVVLTPATPLKENTAYEISWSNLEVSDGQVPVVPLRFTTRPATRGARDAVASPGDFRVLRALPTEAGFPFMDFSTLRLQFSQPLDLATLRYGSSVRLEDATGALVPATLLATGPLLSLDPKADLVAGRTYRLKLGTGVKSLGGDALVPGDYADLALQPQASAPRATMALRVPDSVTDAGTLLSPLTGAAINNVPIASRLLGNNSASQQAGNLYAELAYVPRFPEAAPLTMRRGNLLAGSSVDVKIAGVVPAGLNTEAIRVSIISDANGYMIANPYSRALDAPRHVRLTMDAAMSAGNASANGAFNQDILHIEVVGTAIVKDGKLVMDAVGVTELDVLGLDQAVGVLSFHLEGYADQTTAPAPVADTAAPTLQSWLPGNEAARARPGDPVVLTFSEPVDPASVTATSLKLLKNGVAEPARWRTDGSSIVLRPETPLAHGAEYTVQFTSAITDLAGNGVSDGSHQRAFTLDTLAGGPARAPVILATYPGFPCVTDGRDAGAGIQGRCRGGKPDDDELPLPLMPRERSIQVQFSQDVDPGSVRLSTTCGAGANGSLRVERVDDGCSVVPGRLEVLPQGLRFTPDTPWDDGVLYRYVLGSNGNNRSTTATCDGSDAICGRNGYPLQTQLLAQTAATTSTATGGGPDLEIWFRGGAPATAVAQRLRGLPAYDGNANFVHDAGEAGAVDTGGGLYLAPNAARVLTIGQTGLVSDSNIGCAPGASCPTEQFLFMSNALDAEVADYDPVAGGVRVLIHPGHIVASSFDVHAQTALGTAVAATGLQVFRLRHAVDPVTGKRNQPITGLLRYQGGALRLSATLDLYLDEPALAPSIIGIPIAHNLYSYPLSLSVSGVVHFLPDGRMLVTLANDADVDFTVSLSAMSALLPPSGSITLRIPQGTMRLEGVSAPVKQ